MSADLMYLDNIREFLDDGDGIVTYRWLSHTLGVTCNVAKQMLYWYWEQNHSEGDVHLIYQVSGLYQHEEKEGKSHMMIVTLADEREIDEVKCKLAELCSVHVYSLQKAPLRDRSLLHAFDDKLTEQQLVEYPKWSSLKCTAVERPPPNEEGTSLSVKSSENRKMPDVKFSSEKPPQLSFMESKTATDPSREEERETVVKSENGVSTASKKAASGGTKGNKKSSVAAMFSRMADTEQKDKPPVKEEKREKGKESVVPDKGKGSPKKQPVKKVSAKELPGATVEPPVDTVPAAEEAKKIVSEKAAGKKRTAQEASKDAKNAQKRRRVLVFSSDSEDEQAEEESKHCKEAPVMQAETETKKEVPVSMTTSTTVKKQRKRVRRLKSRMFVDDDGSMVTEKYYESDSTDASGDDKAPPPLASSTNQESAATEQPVLSTSSEEKGTKRAAKKGRSTASAKQQKSLISFFKKN